MSVQSISSIKSYIQSCELVVEFAGSPAGLSAYGQNQKYINCDLVDGELTIKLTLFGENLTKKVENLQVIFLLIHFFSLFDFIYEVMYYNFFTHFVTDR